MRWLVLIAAAVTLVSAYTGWFGKRDWMKRDRMLGTVFTSVMDLQLLLGLVLYFISPLVQSSFQDFGTAMGSEQLRFFTVEHSLIMLIAIVLAHVGSVLARRAKNSATKFRQQAIWFSVSSLAILFAIPWWRPLFPGL